MVTDVVMTVWIRLVQGSDKMKDQAVDEAHGKSEGEISHMTGLVVVFQCSLRHRQIKNNK